MLVGGLRIIPKAKRFHCKRYEEDCYYHMDENASISKRPRSADYPNKHTVDPLYLEHPLCRTSLYLELKS